MRQAAEIHAVPVFSSSLESQHRFFFCSHFSAEHRVNIKVTTPGCPGLHVTKLSSAFPLSVRGIPPVAMCVPLQGAVELVTTSVL